MSPTPIRTSKILLDTKYGKIISANPQSNGTTARCRRPKMTNPSPTDPKSKPQRSDEVFKNLG